MRTDPLTNLGGVYSQTYPLIVPCIISEFANNK